MGDLLIAKQKKIILARNLFCRRLEIRFAQNKDILFLKEIWKLCFGDKDKFIDFYFANRYQEDQTLVLIYNNKPAAMLTLLPVRTVTPDQKSLETVMIYAMATHPEVQNKGFASELLEYCNLYLQAGNITISVLVPQQSGLFDFYRRAGYQDGFFIRESIWTRETIEQLPVEKNLQGAISDASPDEYNFRRNCILAGRGYIAYGIDDISYQKKISQWSGADIYQLEAGDFYGCAVIEKAAPEKFLIKELLITEKFIPLFLKRIAQDLPAKEYILRMPGYLGESIGGTLRPFGMLRVHNNTRKIVKQSACNTSEGAPNILQFSPDYGYMGLAFD